MTDLVATPGGRIVQPRLSVIITFYNQREYVKTAVDSVLAQRPLGLDVIAVDDGSTDGTSDALAEYGDSLRTIVLPRNSGVSAARNAGVAASTGEYLAFLDGDDAFMPWTLDVYEKLLEAKAPMVLVGRRHYFEGLIPRPPARPREISFVEYEDIFEKDRSHGPAFTTLVIRRSEWEAMDGLPPGGLVPGVPASLEELDFLWKLGESGPLVFILDPSTTLYRVHPAQAVQQYEKMMAATWVLCTREREGRYPGGRRRRFERRAAVGGQVIYWSREGVAHGIFRPSLRLLTKNGDFALASVTLRLRRLLVGQRAPQVLPLG